MSKHRQNSFCKYGLHSGRGRFIRADADERPNYCGNKSRSLSLSKAGVQQFIQSRDVASKKIVKTSETERKRYKQFVLVKVIKVLVVKGPRKEATYFTCTRIKHEPTKAIFLPSIDENIRQNDVVSSALFRLS